MANVTPLFHFSLPKTMGLNGILPRACTSEYKIEPIEQCIKREILGLQPKQKISTKDGIVVNQWFGISNDELRRAKHPRRKKDNRPRKA